MASLWILCVLLAAALTWVLLATATVRGGEKDGDAAGFAGSIVDEMEVFRGSDRRGAPPWDGVRRIKHKWGGVGF